MSGFTFRGVHSSVYGICTQDQERAILPPGRDERIVIPGRSGYYDGPPGVYDERVEGLHCAFKCSPPMEQHLKWGSFDLTWSCNPPFALGRTVTQPLTMGANPIAYRGTAPAPCLIVLRNLSQTSASTVTITAVKRSG